MNTTQTSCLAVIDKRENAARFEDWVSSMGYHVELTSGRYDWIVATLIGTKEVWSGYGETTISNFSATAKTKEAAIHELARRCSGATHHPGARKRRFFDRYATAYKFPIFAQPS